MVTPGISTGQYSTLRMLTPGTLCQTYLFGDGLEQAVSDRPSCTTVFHNHLLVLMNRGNPFTTHNCLPPRIRRSHSHVYGPHSLTLVQRNLSTTRSNCLPVKNTWISHAMHIACFGYIVTREPIQNTPQLFATKQKTIFIIKLILGKKVTQVHIMSYHKVLR